MLTEFEHHSRMTIFKSQKLTDAEARIAELEAENATLAANSSATSERVEELAGANERIAELEEANAEIPSLNATIAAHEARIAELESENVVTQEKIASAAASMLAAQGHGEPVDLRGENITGANDKTKTRAELKAMKPREIAAFVKAGGKFTD